MSTTTNTTTQARTIDLRKALETTGVVSFTLFVLHVIGVYCIHASIKLPILGGYFRAIYEVLR
jgi:hypothetical protein